MPVKGLRQGAWPRRQPGRLSCCRVILSATPPSQHRRLIASDSAVRPAGDPSRQPQKEAYNDDLYFVF